MTCLHILHFKWNEAIFLYSWFNLFWALNAFLLYKPISDITPHTVTVFEKLKKEILKKKQNKKQKEDVNDLKSLPRI